MRLKRESVVILPIMLIALFCANQQEPQRIFAPGNPTGTLSHTAIHEASGLVASVVNPRQFWTHNDSGDKARIFLIDDSARHRATFYLEGVKARDWEDIAMMEQGGRNYLLVGDIGDNRKQYPYVTVHLFEEPLVDGEATTIDTIPKGDIKHFIFTYEDGPRDAESLIFDPVDSAIYIISKRELEAGIYRAKLPERYTGDTLTLKCVGKLPHTFITGADISPDGSEILVKNLLDVYYWKRRPGETVATALQRPAVRLPYVPEPQGEAIAFARDGSGYYTLSESPLGLTSRLYFYKRLTE